jgi:hypothetical protein
MARLDESDSDVDALTRINANPGANAADLKLARY